MADLRTETHGKGSMKGVNLAIIAYDNRVAEKDGKVTTHYLDARIHPEDRRAPGQVNLALVSKKDPKSPNGYNNSARYSAGQFEAIQKAAGANVTPLTNQAGEVVGKIYGVKADLLISKVGTTSEIIANTKTLEPSELSVHPTADGKDIRAQIFDSMGEAKAARAAAGPEEAAPEAAAEAPVAEAPAAEAKAKPKATRKPRVAKPELATVGAGAPSSAEPELG